MHNRFLNKKKSEKIVGSISLYTSVGEKKRALFSPNKGFKLIEIKIFFSFFPCHYFFFALLYLPDINLGKNEEIVPVFPSRPPFCSVPSFLPNTIFLRDHSTCKKERERKNFSRSEILSTRTTITII